MAYTPQAGDAVVLDFQSPPIAPAFPQAGDSVVMEFVPLTATVETGQGQTSALVANVTANATIATAQAGQTSDANCLPSGAAAIDSQQGQTTDISAGLRADATLATAQGATTDAAAHPLADAAIATAQAATADITAALRWVGTITTAQAAGTSDATASAATAGSVDATIATAQAATTAISAAQRDAAAIATAQGQTTAATITLVYDQTISLSSHGIAAGSFGTAFIAYSRRTLTPTGMDLVRFGTAVLSGGIRTIDLAGHGSGPQTFGTLQIAYRIREVFPPFINLLAFGRAEVHNNTQYIVPDGMEGAFGTATVHDSRQYATDAGGDAYGAIGVPELTRNPRILAPVGFPSTVESYPSTRWGLPTVYNLTQIVYQLYLTNPDQDEAFGSYFHMTVENRNRSVVTFGEKSERFGISTKIENTGRAVQMEGFDAIGFGADTFIAYRIRNVYPTDVIGPETWSNFGPIVLKTPQLFPTGWKATGFGTPSVVNTRRYYSVTYWGETEWGLPFVSFSPRTVAQYWPWEGVVGQPDVQLLTRYLLPAGINSLAPGVPEVVEHFNRIFPRFNWQHDQVSENARVHNVTPQLYPYGPPMTLWGSAEIRWNPYPLRPQGWDSQAFGGTVIEHREKHVLVPPVNIITRFGPTTQIRNDTPDPPGPQAFEMTGFNAGAFGGATVHKNGIEPDGWISHTFGSPTVILQGAICPGFSDEAFGTPRIIGPQYAEPTGIIAPDQPGSGFTAPKPRVDPYTIWATYDAPEQAIRNNGGAWLAIDSYLDAEQTLARPFFGTPVVSNQRRSVTATGDESSVLGAPAVSLKDRRIQPTGLRSLHMGIPTIPHPVELDVAAWDDIEAFGETTIELFNRALLPAGLGAGAIGVNAIDLFNRALLVTGWDSFTITPPDPTMHAYGPIRSTRVHFVEPVMPVGTDMARFGFGVDGAGFVDFRIRNVYPESWEEFDTSYTPGSFRDRMHVRNRALGIHPGPVVFKGGFGFPTISRGERDLDIND